jgi:hypothetical protein
MADYRDDLVEWLMRRYASDPGLEPGKLMGHPGLRFTANGKYFVIVFDDGFTLKMPDAAYEELLERPDVRPFAPMGEDKPMSTWIVWSLPDAHDYEGEWESIAGRAYHLVMHEPPNPRRTRT